MFFLLFRKMQILPINWRGPQTEFPMGVEYYSSIQYVYTSLSSDVLSLETSSIVRTVQELRFMD